MKNLIVIIALVAGLAAPAAAGSHKAKCAYCPPAKNYDSHEVIRTTKDIDRSRVINTVTVVPKRRVIERNHLVIRDHQTRYVGVVRHNHTIVEYVRPVPTVINYVTQDYRATYRPHTELGPASVYHDRPACGRGYGCRTPLRVRG